MRLGFRRRPALPEARRQALEAWARARLQMLQGDPMAAVIGAVARLRDEGMAPEAAIDAVLGILREQEGTAP